MTLKRWLMQGPLRVPVAGAYRAAVAAELLVERVRDGVSPGEAGEARARLAQATAVIKTFERPAVVARLLRSIRRLYPELAVIVVDDSRAPVPIAGVEHVVLPFNSGVSAGRAAGLAAVRTPYVVMLDDDHVFHRHTRLLAALARMEAEPRIDIMGGRVINLPLRSVVDYSRVPLYPTTRLPVHPPLSRLGGLQVYDKVASFYLARTERLRLVGWDPEIRRLDHADFFTRARGILTSVYNPELSCLHARTPYDPNYMAFRSDVAADVGLLRSRYSAATPPPERAEAHGGAAPPPS